jgi:hypothetical protein
MPADGENLLWLRVAALRGIPLPGRGARARIEVERPTPQKRARVPTARGLGLPRANWRLALLAREAERLAKLQPER